MRTQRVLIGEEIGVAGTYLQGGMGGFASAKVVEIIGKSRAYNLPAPRKLRAVKPSLTETLEDA